MLTYDLTKAKGPLYLFIYECIKKDVNNGILKADEKMPSKRLLAENLGVSTITVENAYEQLIGEGYLYSVEKKGYYVAKIRENQAGKKEEAQRRAILMPKEMPEDIYDFSANQTEPESFPFSVWAKLTRKVLASGKNELLAKSFSGGVRPLREAIAGHLSSFRGMSVAPDQIIVGAGTEYLYGMLVKLLGRDKTYCLATPGYGKTTDIYESCGAKCVFIGMDEMGLRSDELESSGADIVHVSPTHHYPTGITMPVSRRYELLSWADSDKERYIIEDDYDSEFRLKGKPIPSLQSIDTRGRVIYLNTFSKSLSTTIRISYMVLPVELTERYYRDLGFYSCTVPTFEQYVLASFIDEGYFEKHINRMRLYYARKRKKILEIIESIFSEDECFAVEHDTGLHFILKVNTKLSDRELEERLYKRKIRLQSLISFYREPVPDKHMFMLNYSGLDMEKLPQALEIVKKIAIEGESG